MRPRTDPRQEQSEQRVMAVLRQSRGRHLSAGEIHAKANRSGAPLHLATVYRALQRLAARGEVKRSLLGRSHAQYELGSNPGIHLLCEGCGKLREERSEPAERILRSLKRRLNGRFRVQSWQLQVTGRCRDCGG